MAIMKAIQLTWTLICTHIQKYSKKLLFKFWLWLVSTEKRRFLLVCRPAQTQWFVICPYPQNPLYALWSYAIYANIPSKSIICIWYITQDFPRSPSIICSSPKLSVLLKNQQQEQSPELTYGPRESTLWRFVTCQSNDHIGVLSEENIWIFYQFCNWNVTFYHYLLWWYLCT